MKYTTFNIITSIAVIFSCIAFNIKGNLLPLEILTIVCIIILLITQFYLNKPESVEEIGEPLTFLSFFSLFGVVLWEIVIATTSRHSLSLVYVLAIFSPILIQILSLIDFLLTSAVIAPKGNANRGILLSLLIIAWSKIRNIFTNLKQKEVQKFKNSNPELYSYLNARGGNY